MRIVFTTNEKKLSKMARFLSGERVSHIGVIFENNYFNLAFDCSTSGFKVQSAKRFFSINREIESINIPLTFEHELKAMSMILTTCVGRGYDFNAYYWMVWRGILRRFFGIEKSLINPWQSTDKYLCTEVIRPILGWLNINGFYIPANKDISAMTPLEIYNDLKP
jgi:hypothetical protein